MVRNLEAERYFSTLSAHSDVAEEFLRALQRLGDYEVRRAGLEYAAPYGVTREVVFCGAAGMGETYWRLRPNDFTTALATGATVAVVGPEWVEITLFRNDWPMPDIGFWALRAYDFARSGQ